MTNASSLQYLDALSAPMADLIAAVGQGVAAAQRALDAGSIAKLAVDEVVQAQDPEPGMVITTRDQVDLTFSV